MRSANSNSNLSPGVHLEFVARESKVEFQTGIPVFVGFGSLTAAAKAGNKRWCRITSWQQFNELVEPAKDSFLAYAVHGFFENGGKSCVIVPLASDKRTVGISNEPSFDRALDLMEDIEDIDLVCIPDLMIDGEYQTVDEIIRIQQNVLDHCQKMGDRFAILDGFSHNYWQKRTSVSKPKFRDIIDYRYKIRGSTGALYFPWISIKNFATNGTEGMNILQVPPCGHIAGIYARTDARVGVHKAPANEIIEGALDIEVPLTQNEQAELNDAGVNCLRNSMSRGIRVWGARTLSVHQNSQYVSTRRLFLTLIRWIERNMRDLVFETNDYLLWKQIKHRLEGYCYDLFQKGALKGTSPAEAYFVKCDEEINSIEVQNSGKVVSEVGLSSVAPAEFIVVRITQSASGVSGHLIV